MINILYENDTMSDDEWNLWHEDSTYIVVDGYGLTYPEYYRPLNNNEGEIRVYPVKYKGGVVYRIRYTTSNSSSIINIHKIFEDEDEAFNYIYTNKKFSDIIS